MKYSINNKFVTRDEAKAYIKRFSGCETLETLEKNAIRVFEHDNATNEYNYFTLCIHLQ